MTRPAALVLAAFLLAGCGVTRYPSDTEMRLASDVPDFFRFERPLDPAYCLSPATDPSDGTRLTLERSRDGRGDYAVQPGRYGARADELLRISCATGRPIGLVPR
jgi:hypothetical protein